MATTAGSILGNPVRRVEDPRILLGEAKYFDDLNPHRCAHVVFVRSTIAHARITAVDTSDAATMPGVLAVATHGALTVATPEPPEVRDNLWAPKLAEQLDIPPQQLSLIHI